jgi:O-antigen/teichoic acid export membrane protein
LPILAPVRLAQKVAFNASALAVGRVVIGGVGIVTLGITTRYLGVDGYGQLAIAIAFVGIVAPLAGLGIWTVGTREIAKRPDEADHILDATFTLGLVISIVGAALAVAVGLALYGGSKDQDTREAILLLLILGLPLSAPFGAINAYFTAHQKSYLAVIGTTVGSVVTLALVAIAALLNLGFIGVVWAYGIASVAQALVAGALAWGKVRLRPTLDLALSKQLLRATLPIGGTLMIGSLYWRVDILLLSVLSSSSQVALYAVVFRIVDAVMVLPNYLHITIMPELARVAAIRERFDEIIQKTFTVIAVAATGLFVLFVTFADELVTVVGGSAFQGAAPVLRILMIAVAFAYVGSMFGDALFVRDKQKITFVISLLVLPANVGLNLLLIPLWDARGAAVAWAVSELVIVALYAVFYRRVFTSLPRLTRGPQILAAGFTMAVVALAKLLPAVSGADPALVLGIGGALSTVVYFATLYALKAMPREVHANFVLPVVARLRFALKPPVYRS